MAREATIQQIATLDSIPKADFIELATLENLGWTFVVKKGSFKIGDCAVFFAIDSLLPEDAPWAAFLKEKGSTRIKSMRFKGVLSQGLALPYHEVFDSVKENFPIGTDVTDFLGVKHYEKPIPLGMSGNPKGNFPSYVPKTDETMLQNIPNILKVLEGQEIYVTVKCDGSSSTFVRLDDNLDVCSRNWSMYDSENNTLWFVYRKYEIERALMENNGYAIQAEIVGPGIQKNHLGLQTVEMRVFDVWVVKEARHLNYNELISFCQKYNLPMVPVIEVSKMEGEKLTVDYWLKAAIGCYEGTKSRREGIVIRTTKSQYVPEARNRASFKALNNEFLVKDED